MKIKHLFWGLALFLIACSDDDSTPPVQVPEQSVIVGNQGNFMSSDASLSIINTTTGEVTNDAYSSANGGAALGDVLQSMTMYNDELYLVVNNSQKIEVVDPNSLVSIRTIEGFSSPRYIHFISNEKAYVSDLFSTTITIINPMTGASLGSIEIGEGTERFLEVDGEVWATAPGGTSVYMIDPSTNEIVDSIEIENGPKDMVLDNQGKVWVLCEGGYDENWAPAYDPALVRVNPDDQTVEFTYAFPAGTGIGGNISSTDSGDELFILMKEHVYRMSVTDTEFPSEAFIEAEVSSNGMAVDPSTGEILLNDAAGFSGAGTTFHYSATGELIESYSVGVGPWTACWN